MNPIQARDYTLQLFDNLWREQLNYQAYYQNIDNKVTLIEEPYAQVSIINGSADQVTLKGIDKTNRYRYFGILSIGIFVPSNKGLDVAYDLGTRVLNIYRRPPVSCEIDYTGFRMVESTVLYKNFAKLNVIVNFNYDYFY